MRETKRAGRISKDGKWRSFAKFPNLLQYINTQTYYARIKVSGKLIRQSLNTDVWSNARLRLADFIGEKTRTRTSEVQRLRAMAAKHPRNVPVASGN